MSAAHLHSKIRNQNSEIIRVLLIEDNPGDARLIQEMLTEADGARFKLQCVDRLSAGLERLAKGEIDCVLLDLTLPDSHALDTFERVQAQAPEISIVIISGLDDETLAIEAVQRGAQDYLVKGYLGSYVLTRTIRYAIERKRMEEELERYREHLEELVKQRTAEVLRTNIELKVEIDERIRAEKDLKVSEVRYRRLFEAAQDGILILETQTGRIIDVNPFLIEMLGYSHEEFIGKKLWEIGLLKDVVANKEAFRQLRERKYVRYEHLPLKMGDGGHKDVEFVSNAYLVDGREVIQCNIRDISARKRAEEEMREAEKRFRAIFEGAPDAIFLVDPESGEIIDANPTASQLLLRPREEIIGLHHSELYPPQLEEREKEEFFKFVQHEQSKKQTHPRESVVIRSDGSTVPIEILAHLIQVRGKLIFRGTFRDISERIKNAEELKKAYARLEKQAVLLAQQAKMSAIGVLVAGVAHELNNPLTAVLHFAQYCLNHFAEDDRSYTVLQDIEHETMRCIDIVKNLLTFSHSGDGRKEKYELKNPAEILERVARLLSYRIEKEGVSLTSHVDEETPKIRMHVNAMQDVFLNLLTNALDALEESKKKEVRIDVRPDGDGVLFSVADSGIGISPEVLDNIYDPFFTTKPVGRGTGLGLSLCQGIIHAHGGEITCESEPGKGTVFHVFIPTKRRKGAKRDEAHFSDRRR